MHQLRIDGLDERVFVPARVPAVFAEHLERHVRADSPPVGDQRANVVRAPGFFGEIVEDSGLRSAVAVDYDNVLESLTRQAVENAAEESAVGVFRDGECAWKRIQRSG